MAPGSAKDGSGDDPAAASGRFTDLAERSVFAAVFAAVGVLALWIGGGFGVAFVMAAGGVMAWEWRRIHLSPDFSVVAAFQATAVAGAALAMHLSDVETASLTLLALAVVGVAVDLARRRSPWWSFGGALYIGVALILFVSLINAPSQGLETIVWLLLIVIATDVGAYFAGRVLGGPKLWRRVSPGKTWSGALGGVVAAVVIAWLVGLLAGRGLTLGAEIAAALVSILSQCGDLLESAYKRRFGKKDAGVILTGHGGLLDRLDGMIAATIGVGLLALLWPGAPVWAW